jgi:CheY-like chemotaxis protein
MEKLLSMSPDCILMDIRMPGTDGIEPLSRLSDPEKKRPTIQRKKIERWISPHDGSYKTQAFAVLV